MYVATYIASCRKPGFCAIYCSSSAEGVNIEPHPRLGHYKCDQLTCDDALHFANHQRSLVFQLHASASQYDVDELVAELQEPSASTRIILLRVAMDNTACTVS